MALARLDIARMVRPVLPVLAGVVFLELAIGALGPVAAVQLVARGASASLVGLVSSSYYAGFLIGALFGYRVIDRVGHIRAFSALAVLAADAVLLHALVGSPYAWAAFRALVGMAVAGMAVVVESWLNDKTTRATRGRIFATYMVASWAASGVAPLLLSIADPNDPLLFTAVAIAFATAVLPMALTTVGNPEIESRAHFGILRLFRISPLGVVACFGSGLVTSAFYGMTAVYIEGIGLTARHLSVLLSVAILGGLLVQFPIGWLSDRFGRRPLMLICSIAASAFALAITFFEGDSFPMILALAFLFSSATAPFYALGVAQTNDYITARDFVAASGGLLFGWGLGASAGPSAAGWLMQIAGPEGLFTYLAAVLAVIALFTVYRMMRRRAMPAQQQGNFVPIEPQTSGAPVLDPRSGDAGPQPSGEARSR
jgi:MFS family permease